MSMFPSPHPGIINFFQLKLGLRRWISKFPSPHPGIINFFWINVFGVRTPFGFRPLIRGLSISSDIETAIIKAIKVSVPSSGDYQFLPERT